MAPGSHYSVIPDTPNFFFLLLLTLVPEVAVVATLLGRLEKLFVIPGSSRYRVFPF